MATTQSAIQKPQRTFLRKGQGLARFKGKSASSKARAQNQEAASQASTVPQRKDKKAGNAVSNNKPSGGPVAQSRVSSIAVIKAPCVNQFSSKNIVAGTICPIESNWFQ